MRHSRHLSHIVVFDDARTSVHARVEVRPKRAAMMPKRRRTRTQDRAHRVAT
jgi:hypothetical protein